MNLKSYCSLSLLNKITNRFYLSLVTQWGYAIALALALTIIGQAKQVNGSDLNFNNDFNFNNLNGLFTPTAADRFFNEGIEQFEQQVQILTKTQDSDFTKDILQIETEFDDLEVPEAIIEQLRFLERNKVLEAIPASKGDK